MNHCIFCNKVSLSKEKFEDFITFYDEYPVSKGHTLIIPKRHINSIISLSSNEWKNLGVVIDRTMDKIRAKFFPDGFNISINQGKAAGQTVDHLHIHIIPRYTGDVEHPEGGIRNIFGPDSTKKYLKECNVK